MKIALASARQSVDNHGQEILQFEELYSEYVSLLGFQVLVLPLRTNSRDIMKLNPDLILLTGGGDVPLEYYDSDVDVTNQNDRNLLEMTLIDFALKNKIPLFGICRGMQMINGYLGGKIIRNRVNIHPVAVEHKIRVIENNTDCDTNSFHRDVVIVESLSRELKAIALHQTYNHIEAFCGVNYPILGIQWHPERLGKDSVCRQFSDLLIMRLIKRELIKN